MTGVARRVAIAGGGVGGLAAAVSLARAGHQVTVFERAPSLRVGGGALILWCNALTALDAIGLRAAVLAAPSTQVLHATEYWTAEGEHITSMPVGEISRRHGAESLVIARRELVEALYRAAHEVAEVRFGVGVAGLHGGDGAVALALSDGSRHEAEALVGADGLHSSIRGQLGLDVSLRDLHQDLWVGTAPYQPSQLEPGFTIASVGPGDRFWLALLGDGRTLWYATIRSDGASAPPRDLEELAARYARWHAPIPDVIRATGEGDALRTVIRDRRPALPWGRGRVTLLGDSAHSMTPDVGQGACQAIESAVVLARCMDGRTVELCFEDYARRRFERTAEVNRMSFIAATTSTTSGPIACAARNLAMRYGLRATVLTQLDWLFRGCG